MRFNHENYFYARSGASTSRIFSAAIGEKKRGQGWVLRNHAARKKTSFLGEKRIIYPCVSDVEISINKRLRAVHSLCCETALKHRKAQFSKTGCIAHARLTSRYFFTCSPSVCSVSQSVWPTRCFKPVTALPNTSTADMAKAFRKFLPMFDRVLVERLAAESVTKGGIMLPEKSQGKVLQATVVAVGPGALNKSGDVTPVSVKVGEKVLLPEYGGTKVILDDKDYFLFRDADILGKYVD
ncbi:10 kDa heat shock protein, mitochondrial [Astyanax mexicanus]|uniref:10 kDa heat shock protein, mitochondrial n=1 Tax=Astyanax mexicanus TaxID=7994 RepID=A0A8B9GQ14_ASTMX|nr:10 kDa heat shock protein, mitochondrial [Astyanax mexicanus]